DRLVASFPQADPPRAQVISHARFMVRLGELWWHLEVRLPRPNNPGRAGPAARVSAGRRLSHEQPRRSHRRRPATVPAPDCPLPDEGPGGASTGPALTDGGRR